MKKQQIKPGDLVELEPTARLIEWRTGEDPITVFYEEPMPAIVIDVKSYSGAIEIETLFEEYTLLVGETTVIYEYIEDIGDRRLPFRKI